MTTIISSVISAVVTLLVCMINNTYQSRQWRTLVDYRIEELTKRVDKHNNVVERMYKIEEISALHEERLEVCNHRIKDLEALEKKGA